MDPQWRNLITRSPMQAIGGIGLVDFGLRDLNKV
jgi:hypothetical protein